MQSLWDHRDVVGQLTGLESCHGWIQALQEGQAGTAKLGVTLSVREQWGYMELWLWTDESQWRACRSRLEGRPTWLTLWWVSGTEPLTRKK